MRCINPNEARLLDAASGVHVRFRLAGVSGLYCFARSICIEAKKRGESVLFRSFRSKG